MKSFVSDESIVGLLETRRRRNVLLERLESSSDPDVQVTIVSFEEQMRGWLAFISNARNPEAQVNGYYRLHALLDDYTRRPLLDFDDMAAAIFQRLRKQRVRIGTMDLRVAAIALGNDATLISRNLADFRRVPGLRVVDWTT